MRLVDADELAKIVRAWAENAWNARVLPYGIKDDLGDMIDDAPTVDAVPVRHGHWERYLNEGLKWRCSECASRFTTPFNYCPHCGAKMTLD